ncbi:MAG TPA: type II secretion system protein N [Gammaproteobacteria bacterium]
MKRRVVKFAALAAGVYLIGLIALFPASLAVRWFVPSMPGITLGAADGTVWNGHIAAISYRGWNLGAAEWSLEPLALFSLAIGADVQLERPNRGPLAANVRITTSSMEFTALRGAVTLAELARAGMLPANVASGEIILNLARLEVVNDLPVAADGVIGLVDLRSTLLPGVPLGNYEADIETTDAGISATFRELEAPLDIAGQAEVKPNGSYTVTGTITPTPQTPESLRRGLMLLGQPDASGRYEFSFSGTM